MLPVLFRCFIHMEGILHTYHNDLGLSKNTTYTQGFYFIVMHLCIIACCSITWFTPMFIKFIINYGRQKSSKSRFTQRFQQLRLLRHCSSLWTNNSRAGTCTWRFQCDLIPKFLEDDIGLEDSARGCSGWVSCHFSWVRTRSCFSTVHWTWPWMGWPWFMWETWTGS